MLQLWKSRTLQAKMIFGITMKEAAREIEAATTTVVMGELVKDIISSRYQ